MLPAPRVAWLLAPILAWQVLLALPVGAQEELCVNAGFEQGTDGWHLVAGGYGLAPEDQAKAAERARVTDTSVHGGKAALLLDATGLDHEVDAYSSPMKVKPNHGYRLTSFVRQLAGDAGYKVTIDWRTADGKHLVYANDWKGGNRPEDYTAHGGVFASPEDAGEAVIILGAQRGVKCVFDDVSLRELGPAEPLDARPRRDGDGSTSVTGPATVAARSHATWTITYTAGQSGLPCGGGLSLRRSERSYDWSQCQSQDPAAAGFVTASGPRDAEFEVRGGWDVEVIVQWPALAPGDQVTIVLGDTSGGGPGTQVQGRPARGIEWLVSSDADADGDFAPVGSGGRFDVVPGQATKAVLVAPATAEVGRPARLTVEVRDEADNVIPAFTGTCRLTAPEADLPGDVGFGGEPGRKDVLCRFTAPGLHELELTPPEGLAGDRKRIVVSRATGPTGPVDEIAGGAVAANEYVRLVIPGNPFGYGYVALYARVGDEWRQVAALPSLGEVWWPGQDGGSPLRVPLYASDVNYGAPGGATRLVLDGTVKTPGGDVWPFTVTLSLVPGARHLEAEFTLTPRTPQPLLAFYGPLLCAGGDAPSAGGGSFGADKRLALLPGLEYLTAGEVSSDDKGVAWPIRERWAPHPYKVTVPLMAVSSDDATVALMWDPTQQWDGSHAVPRPWFASPNRPEARANHLMALFAPFLPDSFEENLPHAAQPWTPPEGAQLRLAASVALLGGQTDVTDAVRYYASLRPLPTPNPPRSYADELALSAIGYLDTGWRDEEKGWIPSIGHEPSFAPVIADQLLQVALLVPDRALADRIRAQVAEGVARHGTPGLELSFRQGDATAGLEGLRGHARAMMNGQHPEGYWTFADVYSMEGRRATLAAPDDVELGTCVNRLQPILRYALVSGDPAALEAGLRGLKYIERFNRPAGSESWEVPLVNPNLRAAALACECYVDAFRLTGDAHYLDRARYWAWSGLSFIYLWEAPDRPVMPGASISVMGTTFYTHPWFGAAVQWVGLVYASTLRYLADYDQSFDWRRVAELITVSAMRQQETPEDKGGHAGYYPDSYHVVRGEE